MDLPEIRVHAAENVRSAMMTVRLADVDARSRYPVFEAHK